MRVRVLFWLSAGGIECRRRARPGAETGCGGRRDRGADSCRRRGHAFQPDGGPHQLDQGRPGRRLQERRGADRVRLLRAARAAPGGRRRVSRRPRNPSGASAPAGARRRRRARRHARRRGGGARAQPGPLPPCADGLLPGAGAVRRQRRAPARENLRKRARGAATDRLGQRQHPQGADLRAGGLDRLAAARREPHHPRQGNRPELRSARRQAEFAHRRGEPAARGRGAPREGRRQPAARHGRQRRVFAAAGKR